MNLYPGVSLVIPCYNEAERAHRMFEGLNAFAQAYAGDFEFIIVDDGSTDNSLAVIAENAMYQKWLSENKIQIIKQQNTGKGGALSNGIAVAKYPFILTLDADMATQPIQLLEWLQMRKTYSEKEIWIGSRELPNSVVKDSIKRKVVGNIFNFFIRLLFSMHIRDTQCGFKLYPAPAAKTLFASLVHKGWAHDVEILTKANRAGYAIIQMPVVWNAIEGSKINIFTDGMRMLKAIISIRFMNKNISQP